MLTWWVALGEKSRWSRPTTDVLVSASLQMIENQEELRVSQEKVRLLEEEIGDLRHQKSELEERHAGGSAADGSLQAQELQHQAWLHFCYQFKK